MKDFKVINDRPSIVIVNTPAIDVNRLEGEFYKYDYLNAIDKIKKIRFLPLENLVDDIKDGPGGWDINISDYVEQGVPMLRTINIVDGLVNLDECVFIDIEKHKQLKRSRVVKNDVLLSVRGTIGKSAVYSKNFEANINAALVKITLKDNIIDPYFLVAFFNCKYGRLQTERIANGAVQLNMNLTEAKSNLIPIPSPEIQKYIGDKVRKAEELREEAKRLKKEAEEILNAELKLSYFNERVKDAPKTYNWIYGESIEIRIDSQYYINETNFINNEMYKKGLKLKRISEIANVGKGFSYTSLDNKSIPYIRISDLDDLLINFDTAELVDEKTYSEKKSSQLEKYDLIFAITGATIGKVSLFYNSKYSKATLSSDTAFVRLKDKNDAAYVLLYLKSFIGQLGILKGVTGATNRHLSLEHIGDIFIPVIDNKLKQEINMRVIKGIDNVYLSKQLIKEAKQDVEDLIEGNFDMSKVRANS